MCFDPRLDTLEAMVAFGEDAGQPHDGRPAETQSLPIAISWKVVVQAFSHAHFLEVRDDSWDVVYAFVGYCDLWAHPTSLTQFSFSRENSRELSVQRMEGSENAVCQPKSDEKNGLNYSYYSGFTAEPVYPTRTKLIGEISLGNIPSDKPCVVLWKMIAEDGAFPEHDFAELEVSLVEAA
jgi:hypothetical protein